jgi:hypothetical protein
MQIIDIPGMIRPPDHSFLDPPETPGNEVDSSPPRPGFPVLNSEFRHSGWASARRRVFDAMCDRVGVTDWKRLERFASCGTGHWLLAHKREPHRYRITSSVCHSRWCVPCSRARSQVIATNTVAALQGKSARLLTLTLRTTSQPLTHVLDRLVTSFKKLRRTPAWKEHVTGALSFLEVTINPQTRGWHAHYHIIATGKYWSKGALAASWLAVTEDSYIVDVRFIRDAQHVAHYVTSYVTKPINQSAIADPTILAEAIAALHGRKLVLALGAFRKLRLTANPNPQEWRPVDWIGPVLLSELQFSDDPYNRLLHQAILDALAGRTDDDFCLRPPKSKEPDP